MTDSVQAKGSQAGSSGGEVPNDGDSTMDIVEVLKYLPHRYPFLLVDRVLSCVPGETLVALKNVTFNEPYFTGHFPNRPVMPGVLIIEAIAQATGILAFKTAQSLPETDTTYYLAAINNARFKQPVEPGDQLILNVKFTRSVRGVWMFSGEAKVGDKVVASADLMCALRGVEA